MLGGLAGLALFGWMVHYALDHAQEASLKWSALRPGYALLSLALLAASYVGLSMAWRALAEHAGLHARFRDHVTRWSLSLTGKYVPGKIWQGVGRLALYGASPQWRGGVVALFLEAWAQLGVNATLGGALLVFARPALPAWLPWAAIAFGLAVSSAMTAAPVRRLMHPLMRRLGLIESWRPLPGAVFRAVLAFQALGYVAMTLGYLAAVRALGFDLATIAPALAGGLLVSGALGLLAFVIPAGLGVRDGALAWLLTFFMAAPQAVLLAVVSRVWLVAGESLMVGLAGLFYATDRNRAGRVRRNRSAQSSS